MHNTELESSSRCLQTVIRLKFVSKQAFFRDTPHMKYLTYNRMMIAIEHLSRGAGECGGWLAGRLKNLGAFVHDTIFTKGTTTTSYNTRTTTTNLALHNSSCLWVACDAWTSERLHLHLKECGPKMIWTWSHPRQHCGLIIH